MDRKIAVGAGLGLPLSVIIIWAFGALMSDVVIPPEVATAFGAVISTFVGWVTPNAK